MLPKDQTITVRGRRYKLRFIPLPQRSNLKVYGETDPPSAKNKEIRIHTKLSESDLLDTLIHELIHAALDDLDESVVEQLGTDFSRILRSLGYRRVVDS